MRGLQYARRIEGVSHLPRCFNGDGRGQPRADPAGFAGAPFGCLGVGEEFCEDVSKETIHVHNYHCKRDTGLVRVGFFYGPRLGAWYLDYGMVARDGMARAASSK